MALSRNYQLCLSFAVTAFLFFSLTLLPPESAGIKATINDEQLRKMVLGSRPPACVNKCMNCRPCEATLVIPSHKNRIKRGNYVKSSHKEDDTYYLLSWKCRCGNKLYQP